MRALFFQPNDGFKQSCVFDFSKESSLRNWVIINDGVMGGLSRGQLTLSPEGYGKFSGTVSLANNGGFTSIRCNFHQLLFPKELKSLCELKEMVKRINLECATSLWRTRVTSMTLPPRENGRPLNFPYQKCIQKDTVAGSICPISIIKKCANSLSLLPTSAMKILNYL